VSQRFTDPAYLAEQYGDAERLRIRLETHARYSENRGHFYDFLLGHLEARPDLVLLDVGCGPGAQHPRLRQQRMHILGLDRSPGMLAEARAQADAARLDVRLCRGDAERIPLRDASVQRVMANHMLYHVPDTRGALREMRRDPILCQVWNSTALDAAALEATTGAEAVAWSREALAELVANAGWSDAEADEAVELMLRFLLALMTAPEPRRTPAALRAFLRRRLLPGLGLTAEPRT